MQFFLWLSAIFLQKPQQHGITGFRDFDVENGAKIADLSGFFENTRCCGKTCKKMAYMVKYGREIGDVMPVF